MSARPPESAYFAPGLRFAFERSPARASEIITDLLSAACLPGGRMCLFFSLRVSICLYVSLSSLSFSLSHLLSLSPSLFHTRARTRRAHAHAWAPTANGRLRGLFSVTNPSPPPPGVPGRHFAPASAARGCAFCPPLSRPSGRLPPPRRAPLPASQRARTRQACAAAAAHRSRHRTRRRRRRGGFVGPPDRDAADASLRAFPVKFLTTLMIPAVAQSLRARVGVGTVHTDGCHAARMPNPSLGATATQHAGAQRASRPLPAAAAVQTQRRQHPKVEAPDSDRLGSQTAHRASEDGAISERTCAHRAREPY